MPNVTGYEQSKDDPSWFQLHFDDGTDFHTQDPDGSIRKQVDSIVSKGSAQNPSHMGEQDPNTGELLVPPPDASISDVASAAYNSLKAPEAVAAEQARAAPPPSAAAPAMGGASAAGVPGAAPQDLAPQVVNVPAGEGQTTTMSESTTSGLSKEGKASVLAANETARKSQGAADLSNIETTTAIRHHAYDTAVANQAKIQGQLDAAESEKKTRDALVSDELRRIQERNAQPIDPKAAFKQDGMGAYALLASIGTAISNIGDRLNGQRGEDVLKPINDIIDRSVKTQLAEKQAAFETGRLTLAAYQSQAQETTSHLYALAGQQMLAQAKVADTEEEKMGIQSLAASLQAKRDASAATAAQAVADHKTSVWKQSTKPGTPATTMIVPPGGNDDAINQRMIEDAGARSYPGLKPEQRQKQIDEFHKQYDKTRTIGAEADSFEKELKALPGNDLPGSGVIAGHLPGALISSEGVGFRQKAKKLLIDYTHEMGARLNPADVELMNGVFEGAKDKRSMLRAIGMLKGDLAHEDDALRAEAPILHSARRNVEARQAAARSRNQPGREQQNRASVPHPSEAGSGPPAASDDEGDE